MSLTPRLRVVLADDHPLVLESAAAILSPHYDVVAAVGSGEEAVAATARLDPDFVLLDIAMPGLDGFQAASLIRKRGPRPQIAFMSTHMGDDFIVEGLARGGSAFISKARMGLDLIPALEHAAAGHTCVPSAQVLPRWQRPIGHCHDLQLYASDHALLGAIAGFFMSALETGDSIVAIMTAPHLEALEERLNMLRFDTADLRASGRYSPINAHDAVDAVISGGVAVAARFNETLDPVVESARCAAGGSRRVTVYGEMAPQLCVQGLGDAAIALERIADAYAASRHISVLCGYSTAVLHGLAAVSTQICAAHGAIALADVHS